MTRRSSHCNSGHNTRNYSTKGGGGPRPFGVRLTDGPVIKKSASVGSLLHYSVAADSTEEYHSDDPDHGSASRRMRKKEIPWTEEEHRNFLLGLNNLGKGDWRGISKVYVPSRTPSQVASHAQKYYICQISANRKKKRTSPFDKVPTMEANSSVSEPSSIPPPIAHTDNEKLVPSTVQETNISHLLPSPDLSLTPAVMPLPFQLRPQDACSLKEDGAGSLSHQQIPRSVPVVPEEPIKELEKMSHLSLGPPALSLGLPSNP